MFTDTFQIDPNQIIVKDILTSNIKAAHVFEKHGIDFCCKGNRPLKEACDEKNVSVQTILSELDSVLSSGVQEEKRYENWDLKFLTEYIVNNHHSYVRNAIPQMIPHLEKVAFKHGNKYPELIEIKSLFEDVAGEMYSHMHKEETILFHIIRYLVDCKKFNEKPRVGGFKTVKNPIESMEAEHSNAGSALERIRTLTNNFTPPADACNTFQLTYQELHDFEKDLHIHVHLENNILFPKSIELEKELLAL
ncbi:MAG: iron-sulfur cluster repair di-iron protein [Ignavibacteriales bacterium]|jgi:regulator of cell morphogenesis and NO signaling|nr:MAG: iron-sulfur cluster repair di-iron protein [Ignavibacteriales bacterium]